MERVFALLILLALISFTNGNTFIGVEISQQAPYASVGLGDDLSQMREQAGDSSSSGEPRFSIFPGLWILMAIIAEAIVLLVWHNASSGLMRHKRKTEKTK